MATSYFKRGDQLPDYTAKLRAGRDGVISPINLTGCNVKFIMSSTLDNTPKVNAAAVVVNANDGEVSYLWATNDLDAVGEYRVEWQITYPSGKVLTVPSEGYDIIRVQQDNGS